jgi:hypothetical protein
MRRFASLVVAAVVCSGCYHVTVITGAPPSAQTIDLPWQMSFAFGLVPPPAVATNPPCTQGVARVETERSFLNGLASAVTSGIVTPIHAMVTCASGPVAR